VLILAKNIYSVYLARATALRSGMG